MDFFDIIYDYSFILQLVFVYASLILTFYPIRGYKSILEMLLQLVVLFVVGTLLNWGLFCLPRVIPFLRGTNFPISWLIIIMSYLFLIKIPLANKVLMGGTLFVVAYAIITIARQLIFSLPEEAKFTHVFFFPLIMAYGLTLRKLSLGEYTDLPTKSATMMAIITTSMASLMIVKEAVSTPEDFTSTNLLFMWTTVVIIIISVCSYLMLYYYAKARKSMVQLQVENKLLEADRERIESFETASEDFKLLRHDIKNQMNLMKIMLENKDYDELQKYFDSIDITLLYNSRYDFVNCGDSTINSVINMEIVKAGKSDIKIMPSINIDQELPFEKSEISRILVNLIDNAIEALERIEDSDEVKRIFVSLVIHGEYLYIGVQNRVSADVKPRKILKMNTEKEDQTKHGFGHRIVKKIALKYNGHVNYSIEDHMFFAEVMLDLNYDAKR